MKTYKPRSLAVCRNSSGKKNGMIRKKQLEIYKMMADKYFRLLKWLYKLKDKDIEKGLQEGKGKFLSNLYLSRFRNKCTACEYITPKAQKLYEKQGNVKGLVFEHIVPKKKHIQKECEELARQGTLQVGYIEELLRKYFHCALVTSEEDARLLKNKMPADWDGKWKGKGIFARYEKAGIELLDNPFYGK